MQELKIQNSQKNIGVNLCGPGLGRGFLAMTPKTQATKEKINWDFIEIKNIYASKDTIK